MCQRDKQEDQQEKSQQKTSRPNWDKTWMDVAHIISQRSYDKRYKVGAVVVSEDNTQLLSLGYNGNYAGGPNIADSEEPGQSGFLHAEINALLKLDYNNPKRKKMYLTLSPCQMCAKAIVNAGVDEVVYHEEYRDTTGIQILKDSGVQTRTFSSTRE